MMNPVRCFRNRCFYGAFLFVLIVHTVSSRNVVPGPTYWYGNLPPQLQAKANIPRDNEQVIEQSEKSSNIKQHSSYIHRPSSSFSWPDLFGNKRAPIFVGRRTERKFGEGPLYNDAIYYNGDVIQPNADAREYYDDVGTSYDDVNSGSDDVSTMRGFHDFEPMNVYGSKISWKHLNDLAEKLKEKVHSRQRREVGSNPMSTEPAERDQNSNADKTSNTLQKEDDIEAEEKLLAKLKETGDQRALLSLVQNLIDNEYTNDDDLYLDSGEDLSLDELESILQDAGSSDISYHDTVSKPTSNTAEKPYPTTKTPQVKASQKGEVAQSLNDLSKQVTTGQIVGSTDKRGPKFVGKRENDEDELHEIIEDMDKRRAPGFVGKRLAPRFVGKRRAPGFVGKRSRVPTAVGKVRAPGFVGKRTVEEELDQEESEMFEKRRAPNFVGKRPAPGFVGKRRAPNFVGKRRVPSFVGKRRVPGFVGKRRAPGFVGKRYDNEDIQDFIDFVNNLKVEETAEKRRAPSFIGKRSSVKDSDPLSPVNTM